MKITIPETELTIPYFPFTENEVYMCGAIVLFLVILVIYVATRIQEKQLRTTARQRWEAGRKREIKRFEGEVL